MNSIDSYTARLEDKVQLNDKFIFLEFEMEKPHRVEFIAGQFISIQIGSEGLRRAYSIASPPEYDYKIELIIDVSHEGKGANYLNSLQFGDKINFSAPQGNFIWQNKAEEKEINFIATGSGVAPFRSLLWDLLKNKGEKRIINLHWGMRHEEDLFLLDEWEDLEDAFPNFHFHPTLSQASEKWELCRGHVTDCLSIHQWEKQASFYLCGNRQMIQDVKQILQTAGVDSAHIYHEMFF